MQEVLLASSESKAEILCKAQDRPLQRNLRKLNDQDLLRSCDRAVQQERQALSAVLYHFQEVQRRRLFSSLGCSSLYDWAVKVQKYSEYEAHVRISAMRLLTELPELEEKIESGEMKLTHLTMAQTLFRQEDFKPEQKLEVLEQLSNKTTREAKKVINSFMKEPPAGVELKLLADDKLQDKIAQLKGLLAHSHPNISLGELIHKLCDLGLERWNPGRPKRNPKAKPPSVALVQSNQKQKATHIKLRKVVHQNHMGRPRNCAA